MNRSFHFPRHERGISLIEVMISVLILGVGMLGVAAMQATALKNNQSAMSRSQVVMQTYTILDAMRANRNQALVGGYNTGGLICTAPTGSSLIDKDKAAWIKALKSSLADADSTCGGIACNDGNCKITVQWDDSRAKEVNGSDGKTEQTIVTVTQL